MKLEASMNGKVKVFLIPETDLDREILKRITEESQIEIAGPNSVHFNKALAEGSVIISEPEKTSAAFINELTEAK